MWNDTVACTDKATADMCAVAVPHWESDINWGSSDSDSDSGRDTIRGAHLQKQNPKTQDADEDADSSGMSEVTSATVAHPYVRKFVRRVVPKARPLEQVTEIRLNEGKNYFQRAAADELSWEPRHHIAHVRNHADGQGDAQPAQHLFGWDNDAGRHGGYQGHVACTELAKEPVNVQQTICEVGASGAPEDEDMPGGMVEHACTGSYLHAFRKRLIRELCRCVRARCC